MNFLKTRFRFFGANLTRAFSLVELLVALIIISLIVGALMPVITKKLKSSGITIGAGGGGGFSGPSTCPTGGLYYDMDTKKCEVCPAGNYCDGVNKIPCDPGTFSLNKASVCTPCPENYYSLEGATECLENTAQNCAEKSKTQNACESCNGDDILVDGNCVSDVPVYTFTNNSGADVTTSATEVTKDTKYWTIKIKSTGTLSFTTLPANLIDVFVVGGGAGGGAAGTDCGASVGGGGNYNILRDIVVFSGKTYPIIIGTGGAGHSCGGGKGGTSSAFGAFSYGGVSTGNHSICPFNEASCDLKYGEKGSGTNQIQNTGNGGKVGRNTGMSGVVFVRGKLGKSSASDTTIPSYSFLNGSGSDTTTTHTTLNVTSDYWYIKYAASGSTSFHYLPNDLIDVFVVGGGAGGGVAGTDCGASVGGGGTYSISRDVAAFVGKTYPIVIGTGGEGHSCSGGKGGTSSAFGLSSRGGLSGTSYAICPFGDSTCDFKYGNSGSSINQNLNTGNGGFAGRNSGMNGVAIIRGKRKKSIDTGNKLPVYKLTNSSGSDLTNTSTSLSVADTYWYLRIIASGDLKFDSIKNSKIDVFVVGGGAGGSAGGTDCGASVGGGGNYNISRDIEVNSSTIYPIIIGTGGEGHSCGGGSGGESSAFEISAQGGSGTTSHKVCLFNGTDCTVTYGDKGSNNNQFQNSGNGGCAGRNSGMNGVVIIRGTL